jgi:hypothetical protein
MIKLIQVHPLTSDKIIYINTDHIVMIKQKDSTCKLILTNGESFDVEECIHDLFLKLETLIKKGKND